LQGICQGFIHRCLLRSAMYLSSTLKKQGPWHSMCWSLEDKDKARHWAGERKKIGKGADLGGVHLSQWRSGERKEYKVLRFWNQRRQRFREMVDHSFLLSQKPNSKNICCEWRALIYNWCQKKEDKL
jgi:hypothetical protein